MTAGTRWSGNAPDVRERIAEIGELLALGLIRLRQRNSSESSRARGESSLDCVGTQSGDADLVLRQEPSAR